MKIKTGNKRLIIAISLLLIGVINNSCKKQLNINNDPSNPALSQGTPAVVFPAAVLATAGKVGGDLEVVGGMWSQFFTQFSLAQQYVDIESYNLSQTDINVNNSYDILFTQGLEGYQFVINQARASSDWNYYLLGTVMNAYTAEVLVDLYNEMPYSQAFQGAANVNPKFDSGYAIYTALINSIDTALNENFNALTVTPPGNQDMVFGGNMPNWIAFANTLKLKMYLRMTNAYPAVAQAGITAMYNNNPSFLTVDASMTKFSDNPQKDNPLFDLNIRTNNTPDNLKASTTFVSWLEANNDPRINYYFASNDPPSENQGDYTNSVYDYAGIPTFAETPTDPVEFISAAESYFLQAEADVRYFGGTKAQGLYNQGVAAAFAQAQAGAISMAAQNSSMADFYDSIAKLMVADSFTAASGVYAYPVNGTMEQQIQAIIVQKWASCAYGCHALESFFEENRTGYPLRSPVYSTNPNYIPGQLVIGPNSSLPPGEYAKRMVYPYDETSRNTNAPQTIVPEQTPVWWGK